MLYIMWYNIILQKPFSISRQTRLATALNRRIMAQNHSLSTKPVTKGTAKLCWTSSSSMYSLKFHLGRAWVNSQWLPWTTSRRWSWIFLIRPFPPRNLDPRCLECHVCPGTSSRYSRTLRPLCQLLPSLGQWIRASPRGPIRSFKLAGACNVDDVAA